jgi:hypothetical protein
MKIHQWFGLLVIGLSISAAVQASVAKVCTPAEIEAAQSLAKTIQFEEFFGDYDLLTLARGSGDTSKCSGLTQYDQNMNWQTCARALCICNKAPKSEACKLYNEPVIICGITIAKSTIKSCTDKQCGTDWEAAGFFCNQRFPE